MTKRRFIQLPPGHTSCLILVAGTGWTAGGRRLIRSRSRDESESLYEMLSDHRHSKAIMDCILAIYARDKATIKRHKCWVSTAWAFVTDSVWRRYFPCPARLEAEFKTEWAKLDPLRKLVAPYLPEEKAKP